MQKVESVFSKKNFPKVLFVVVMFLLPVFIRQSYFMHVLIMIFIYAILGISWDVVVGYTGILSFAHAAFLGIGAYGSALVSMRFLVSPWLSIFLGGFISAIIGFGIGLVVLRMGKIYLCMATIAFSEVCRHITITAVDITRGDSGLWGIPQFPTIEIPNLFTIKFGTLNRIPEYYLALILFLFSLLVLREVMRSRIGYFFRSIRDNEDAAETLGVDIRLYKLLCFALTSFFAGLAGGFYAHYIGTITPHLLSLPIALIIVVVVYVGGMGTLYGPIIGAFIVISLLEGLHALGDFRLIVYGSLLVLIVMFLPKGIYSVLSGVIRRLLSLSMKAQENA